MLIARPNIAANNLPCLEGIINHKPSSITAPSDIWPWTFSSMLFLTCLFHFITTAMSSDPTINGAPAKKNIDFKGSRLWSLITPEKVNRILYVLNCYLVKDLATKENNSNSF